MASDVVSAQQPEPVSHAFGSLVLKTSAREQCVRDPVVEMGQPQAVLWVSLCQRMGGWASGGTCGTRCMGGAVAGPGPTYVRSWGGGGGR